jgi:uncharacterized protein
MAESKLYFKNQDGMMLCGILAKPAMPTTKCVLLCHGLTGTGKAGEVFEELAPQLAQVGFASFRFDFRGHGESEGNYNDITLTGEKRDIEAAVAFVKPMGYRNLGLLGASFAAGPVCLYLRENPGSAKALVFWNPILEYRWLFDSGNPWPRANFGLEAMAKLRRQGYIDIGKYKLKIGQGFINEMNWLRPLDYSQNFSLPTLFVHGDKDNTVPCDHSARYARVFKDAPVEIIAGADHGFHDSLLSTEGAVETTKKFFSEKL